jgi:tRNA (guanine37-N1)-methyltransferase
MRFNVLTIFPDFLTSPLQEGMIRRAIQDNIITVAVTDIRSFAVDKHSMTDDRPFGGGEGMVMKPEPVVKAIKQARLEQEHSQVIFLSPQGRCFNQQVAGELAELDHLILLCGRYEGVDERVRNYIDDEISIGDYILTGGELAALVIIDAVTRLLPGVLGCRDSARLDTFSRGGLKYPQYTRPREFAGKRVPDVLLSGDHQAIAEYRLLAAVRRTKEKRPDLFKTMKFSVEEKKILKKNGLL